MHEPVALANQLASLDALSKGRLTIAVGVGWSEAEYGAVGGDFATRGRRLDEALDLFRRALARRSGVFRGSVPVVRRHPAAAQARGPDPDLGRRRLRSRRTGEAWQKAMGSRSSESRRSRRRPSSPGYAPTGRRMSSPSRCAPAGIRSAWTRLASATSASHTPRPVSSMSSRRRGAGIWQEWRRAMRELAALVIEVS